MNGQANPAPENSESNSLNQSQKAVLQSLEQLGVNCHGDSSDYGGQNDLSNLQLSSAALNALNLYVRQSTRASSRSTGGERRSLSQSEECEDMQNQKKAKASEEEETTTLKTGKLTTERASYSKNVQSKQPTIAGDNRVQRKTKFLLVSKHVYKQEDNPISPSCTNESNVRALERLQKRHQDAIIYFRPLQEGWNSLDLFNQCLEEHPGKEAEIFGLQSDSDHRLAWSVREYPKWYYELFEDVAEGRLEKVKKFATEHDNYQLLLNLPDINGQTLLHRAASHGQKEVVECLIKFGAWLNVCDSKGRTPLHDACWTRNDNSQVILYISKRNPSLLNAIDEFGALPWEYIPLSASHLLEKYYDLIANAAEELWGSNS